MGEEKILPDTGLSFTPSQAYLSLIHCRFRHISRKVTEESYLSKETICQNKKIVQTY